MEEAQTALSEQKAETVRVEGQATQAQQLAENVAAALEASRAAVDAAAAENAALRAELDARFLATAQEVRDLLARRRRDGWVFECLKIHAANLL